MAKPAGASRGRGGSKLPTSTSTHPSQHRVPHQEQPPGSPAGRGCPAVQGSHREGFEPNISRVLQPTVPGTKEDRGSASRHRSVCIGSSHGGAALENGNTGIRSSSHQEARMDCIHRHKRCLASCPNAHGCQKVPAIQSEQEDLPVHLSTFRIGNISRVHQATKTRSSMVEAAKCQAAHLLGRLADPHSLQNRPRCIPR